MRRVRDLWSRRCGGQGRYRRYIYALLTSADVTQVTAPARPHPLAGAQSRGRIKIRRVRLHPPRSSLLRIPPSPCEGAEGVYTATGHGEGGAPPPDHGRRRRRRDEEGGAGRGARDGAAEAELVVARHRARRGVGAAAPRDAPRGIGAAARAERHGRRPRRAPRLHRSGVRLRAARRPDRLPGVRRGREEPAPRDAPRARPLLRRPRRRWRRRGGVLVRRRVGGVFRGVAAREPHVHTRSRRHAGDGEDAAEAVGAGGGAIHADPPLNNSWTAMPSPPLACIGRRERKKNHSRCRRKESPPASDQKKEEKKRISVTRVWWAAAFHPILSWTPC